MSAKPAPRTHRPLFIQTTKGNQNMKIRSAKQFKDGIDSAFETMSMKLKAKAAA